MDFKDIELKDKEWADEILKYADLNSTDYNFTVMYIWKGVINTNLARYKDLLLVRFAEKKGELKDIKHAYYLYPVGKGSEEDYKEAVNLIVADSEKIGASVVFVGVQKEQAKQLHNFYPDRFDFEFYRNSYDYLYLAEDLLHLKGKKFQSKRNFISRFERMYKWQYEEITESNLAECKEMSKKWCLLYGCKHNPSLIAEGCSVQSALDNFHALGLHGGLLRVFEDEAEADTATGGTSATAAGKGKVIAFTVGEMTSSDTVLVHIEKAFTDYVGAYPAISKEFLLHNEELGFKYVNREDDAGDEGLRKAKLEYHPFQMIEKQVITLKGHPLEIVPE